MMRFTVCAGASVKVVVGGIAVNVAEGDGVIVFSGVTGDITVTFVEGVCVSTKIGGGMINGVAVTIPGVCVGMGVQIGNVCGVTPQMSHALISVIVNRKRTIFFIIFYYTPEVVVIKQPHCH